MVPEMKFTFRSKDIAKLANARLTEITGGNITPALVNTYSTAGIIPARLRKEVGGIPLFAEEAALWAAIAKALFISRHKVKLEWIRRALRLVVPSGYGNSSVKGALFPNVEALWEWLKENRTWGRLLRYSIESGIRIGDEDEDRQLPAYIADQADRG
jgi:hypothetical protein